jgi:uncharacterized protein (TIGR00645 family)
MPPTTDKQPQSDANSRPLSLLRRLEHGLEQVLFASRWLLAPFFLGLALSIIILLYKFAKEMWHIAAIAPSATGTQLVAEVLSLVDLTLTASLMVIVVFSGYENFVSRIDHTGHRDWPEWMGSIDFTGLKLKLLSSIVAISAVQLLKQFMAIDKISDRDLLWSTVIHVVFVVSSVLLALSDKIAPPQPNLKHTPDDRGDFHARANKRHRHGLRCQRPGDGAGRCAASPFGDQHELLG